MRIIKQDLLSEEYLQDSIGDEITELINEKLIENVIESAERRMNFEKTLVNQILSPPHQGRKKTV
ncbi:hypothetical protein ACPBEH_05095 [Latilactobacillus sp. 5-91]|uniref:hypothetical protein n=1 Tax=Latilactobacillus sp. 5-91 TaxID=3410924 RepID=UPI003C747D0D